MVERRGERLDRLVADASGRGRRIVKEWFTHGCVRVDGHICGRAIIPPAGSEVVVELGDDAREAGTAARLAILIEHSRFVVVSKPAGMHCERGRSSGCVADLLEARYGDLSTVGDR